MKYYTKEKKVYEIDESNPFEYTLTEYDVFGDDIRISYMIGNDVIATIFNSNEPESSIKKIQAMIDSSAQKNTDNLDWPIEFLYDENGSVVGYTRHYFKGKELEYPDIEDPLKDLNWYTEVLLVTNLASAVKNVHQMGHVVGDLEIVVKYDDKGNLALGPCDAFAITDLKNNTTYYFDKVIDEEGAWHFGYIAPEMIGKVGAERLIYTKEMDNFVLATLIYQILSYNTHPYELFCLFDPTKSEEGWKYRCTGGLDENILNGTCILFPETYKPCVIDESYSRRFTLAPDEIFPSNICELFRKTFVDGHKNPEKRATAEEWYTALCDLRDNLKQCDRNPMHYYYNGFKECPLCLNEKRKSGTGENINNSKNDSNNDNDIVKDIDAAVNDLIDSGIGLLKKYFK